MLLGRSYLLDPAGFVAKHPQPWIVWKQPCSRIDDRINRTRACSPSTPEVGGSGESVGIEVVKSQAGNGFPFGVTIGHAESNDIVIRDPSVSRFHAYLQGSGTRWSLADADSKNGTFLGGVQLPPSKLVALPERAQIRLGAVELEFFQTGALARWLEEEISR
jgi:hypothetical protein